MDHKALFAEVDRLYPEYLQFLETICLAESPTSCKEGVDKVGKIFMEKAKGFGWEIEVCQQEVAGDAICITMNPDSPGKPIILSGHMDTVHPVGKFPSPVVWQDEENIYGPGVMDCKGGIAAAILCMAALANCGFSARPVQLLLQSDEETSSKTSGGKTVEFMCEKAKKSIAFINLEGAKDGTAVLFRKGILRFRFEVQGIARHAAACSQAANAITEAAYKIIELERLKDDKGLSCNCGVINGGTAINSVADRCTFFADIRFSSNEEMEQARKIVSDVTKKVFVPGCSTVSEEISFRPAMERSEKNYALLDRINEICGQVSLPKLTARDCLSGSDAAHITQLGIPCVDDLGIEGNFIHSVKEYAVKSSLAKSAKYLAAIASEI